MQAFKIIQTCYLECVLRNVINFSWNQHRPTISGDFFFAWLQANTDIGMMHYEDAAFVLFLSVWRGFKIYW
jgi:hypothetical protein